MCIQAFWNVTVQEDRLLYVKMKALCSFGTLGTTQPATQCHIPGDLNLQATLPSTTSCMTGSSFHLPVAGTLAMLTLTHQTAQHNSSEDSNKHSLL